MNSIEVPTDNLYKFMAIAGLLTALTSMYLGVRVREQVAEEWHQHMAVFQPLETDAEQFDSDLADLAARIAAMGESSDTLLTRVRTRRSSLSATELKQIEVQLERLEDERRAFAQKPAELGHRLYNLKASFKRDNFEHAWLSDRENISRLQSLVLHILTVAGFLASALGFWLWYVRVQRHLDRAVAKGAKP